MQPETQRKTPSVLSIIDWYYPSYKAGGPVRSLVNIAALLKGEVRFFVLCGMHEIDGTPLDVTPKKFVDGPFNEQVYYTKRPSYGVLNKWKMNNPEGVFHLNGMYSFWFTIWPLFLLRFFLKPSKIIVSPRGMLNPGALAIKSHKKRFFLKTAKVLGLFSKVVWHATSAQERDCILNVFPQASAVQILSNIPVIPIQEVLIKEKEPGELRLFSMTRVVPIKMLEKLAESLKAFPAKGAIVLDIYGPLEDAAYTAKLEQLYNGLPGVQLSLKGPVEPFLFKQIASQYDVFYLPSANENFGHAIFEAFAHGIPVMISDQTPWQNLVKNQAGWDIPLASTSQFVDACNTALSWDKQELTQWKKGALAFAQKNYHAQEWIHQYTQLFNTNA